MHIYIYMHNIYVHIYIYLHNVCICVHTIHVYKGQCQLMLFLFINRRRPYNTRACRVYFTSDQWCVTAIQRMSGIQGLYVWRLTVHLETCPPVHSSPEGHDSMQQKPFQTQQIRWGNEKYSNAQQTRQEWTSKLVRIYWINSVFRQNNPPKRHRKRINNRRGNWHAQWMVEKNVEKTFIATQSRRRNKSDRGITLYEKVWNDVSYNSMLTASYNGISSNECVPWWLYDCRRGPPSICSAQNPAVANPDSRLQLVDKWGNRHLRMRVLCKRQISWQWGNETRVGFLHLYSWWRTITMAYN